MDAPRAATPALTRVPLLALLIASLLLVPQVASAHKLSLSKARAAVSAVARELAREDGLSSGFARNCSRVNQHRVRCEAVTQGYDSSVGGTATCVRQAVAFYRPHKSGTRHQSRTVRVGIVNSGFDCSYDYSKR